MAQVNVTVSVLSPRLGFCIVLVLGGVGDVGRILLVPEEEHGALVAIEGHQVKARAVLPHRQHHVIRRERASEQI